MEKTKVLFIQPSFDYVTNKSQGGLKYNKRQGWALPLIKALMKRTSEYNFESWSLYDSSLENRYDNLVIDDLGFKIRIFPSIKLLRKPFSYPLLDALNSRVKDRQKILVFVMSQPHILMSYMIALLCRNNIPLAYSSGGPRGPPLYKFRFTNNIFFLFQHFFDRMVVRNYYDKIISANVGEYLAAKKLYGLEKCRLDKYPTLYRFRNGLEFGEYNITPKLEYREELGLSPNKKYIIHVGNYVEYRNGTSLKGLREIINVYKQLRNKIDIDLILIGGLKEQALYNLVVESGAIHIGRVEKEKLHKYLAAADLYLLLITNPEFKYFAGFGSSPLESIKAGTPIVSTQLIHMPSRLRSMVGNNPDDFDNLYECVNSTLNQKFNKKNMWKIANYALSWDMIVNRHIRLYKNLLSKYY